MAEEGKLPAFQFYPADWRKDPGVQSLSFEDRGVWIEILCLMHESPRRGVLLMPNGAPMSSVSLARIIGIPLPKLIKALDRISLAGVSDREQDTGAMFNRRMVRDEKFRQLRAQGGFKGGQYGHLGGEYGKRGGRPRKTPVTIIEKPPLEAPLNPPPSSSSSSSTSVIKKNTYSTFENVLLTDDEFAKLLEQFGGRDTADKIENLGQYIASKGKRYKSHYATLLVWARKNGNGNHSRPSKEVIPPLSHVQLSAELQAECEADILRLRGEA